MADVTISQEEYARLLVATEADDTIVNCEVCGAWMVGIIAVGTCRSRERIPFDCQRFREKTPHTNR